MTVSGPLIESAYLNPGLLKFKPKITTVIGTPRAKSGDSACAILGFGCEWPRGMMNQGDRIREILATYHKHGWRLRRVLLLPETRVEVLNKNELTYEGAIVEDANVDALWFSRPSHGKREAWELRLIAETPYALFEMFEADEPEELHEELRQEMQLKLGEFTTRKRP